MVGDSEDEPVLVAVSDVERVDVTLDDALSVEVNDTVGVEDRLIEQEGDADAVSDLVGEGEQEGMPTRAGLPERLTVACAANEQNAGGRGPVNVLPCRASVLRYRTQCNSALVQVPFKHNARKRTLVQ